jgi:hypothetical protein
MVHALGYTGSSTSNGLRRLASTRAWLMLSGLLVAIAGGLFLASAAGAAPPPCTDNYTGASDGDWGLDSNWTNASDRSIHLAPTASDIVCLPIGITVDVDETAHAKAIEGTTGSLDIEGGARLTVGAGDTAGTSNLEDLRIGGGTLDVEDTIEVATTTLTGGTLEGSGTVSGHVTNTSGTVEAGDHGMGTLTIAGDFVQSGGVLTVPLRGAASGDYPVLAVQGSVTLDGTVALEPTAGYARHAKYGDVIYFLSWAVSGSGRPSATTGPGLHFGERISVSPAAGGTTWDAVVGEPDPPSSTTAPVVSGTAQEGSRLRTTKGAWTNDPSAFYYRWEECTSPAATGCTEIPGASGSHYAPTAADVGRYVKAVVGAYNDNQTGGTATWSRAAGPVASAPPAPTDTTPPAITGTPDVVESLTCAPGTWTGSPTVTYAWRLNESRIPDATRSTYAAPADDAGGRLTCEVKARNAGGSARAVSAPVTVNTPEIPMPAATRVAVGLPAITALWSLDADPITRGGQKVFPASFRAD